MKLSPEERKEKRIEVRKQIKHTQHFAWGTSEFDPVKKSQSIQNVASQETKLREEDKKRREKKEQRKEMDARGW